MGELSKRRALDEVISENGPVEDAHLIAWVLVAEWANGEGEEWLTRMSAGADPEKELPPWRRSGLLHEALTTDWTGITESGEWVDDNVFDEEDDEEEEE